MLVLSDQAISVFNYIKFVDRQILRLENCEIFGQVTIAVMLGQSDGVLMVAMFIKKFISRHFLKLPPKLCIMGENWSLVQTGQFISCVDICCLLAGFPTESFKKLEPQDQEIDDFY